MGANHNPFTMAAVVRGRLGRKANVLGFGPGGYRFSGPARAGVLLTVLLLVVSMVFLPLDR